MTDWWRDSAVITRKSPARITYLELLSASSRTRTWTKQSGFPNLISSSCNSIIRPPAQPAPTSTTAMALVTAPKTLISASTNGWSLYSNINLTLKCFLVYLLRPALPLNQPCISNPKKQRTLSSTFSPSTPSISEGLCFTRRLLQRRTKSRGSHTLRC